MKIDAGVAQLVSAMASYSSAHAGFDPTTACRTADDNCSQLARLSCLYAESAAVALATAAFPFPAGPIESSPAALDRSGLIASTLDHRPIKQARVRRDPRAVLRRPVGPGKASNAGALLDVTPPADLGRWTAEATLSLA
jgi:hypothetical protein